MRKNILLPFILLVFIVIYGGWWTMAAPAPAVQEASPHMPLVRITTPQHTHIDIKVEVASTPEALRDGLMFRTSLAPQTGMLFRFPRVQPVSFWMKNTLIPLDMLFIDEKGSIIKIHAQAQPQDLTPVPSDGAVQAVIEIAGGEAARLGITAGSFVDLPKN